MVNRTGQGAPIPQLNIPRTGLQELPTISYGNASPKSTQNPFQSIVAALQNANNHVQDRLDLAAQVEATRAGAIAGQDGVPALQDSTTIRGRAFNLAAQDAVETQFEVAGLSALNDAEKKHQFDPKGFEAAAGGWLNGTAEKLDGYDPALSQKIKANYTIRMQSAMSRIEDRAMAVTRDKQMENVLTLQTMLQDDLENTAAQLFTPDTTPERRSELLQHIVASGAKITSTAHQMGADGRLLFDATQRVKLQTAAESAVSTAVGTAWLNAQPDKIAAYDTWRKGAASIDLPDGQGGKKTMSLKDLLGVSGYQTAEKDFFDSLRSELALQAQVDTAKDRAFKKNSDQLFVDMSQKVQDGQLNLNAVEAAKGQLEPDKFVALRAMAKSGGASVSDGAMVSDLMIRDANGEDVRRMATNVYENGGLTRDDYIKIYTQNTTRLNAGLKDPVDAARDGLSQRLGVLSKELGIAQSSAIGQANVEYEMQISNFQAKEGRKPTINEAAKIANDVYTRYSAMDADSTIVSLPLPKSMTQAEKLDVRLSTSNLQKKIDDLTARKLKEVGGDTTKLADDPEFTQEIILLKKYYDVLNLKETGNARGTNSQPAGQ